MILLSITTAFIFFSYYFLSFRLRVESSHQRIILAGLWSFGQIILTQLILGLLGFLYLPLVVYFNISITVIVIAVSSVIKQNPRQLFVEEYQRIVRGIRCVYSLENAFLIILIVFTFIWIVAAIYYLPLIRMDDLTYHLPPIYEYIINHRIFLLPVDVSKGFAFPENAELLFMWPTIFLHSQGFAQTPQLVVALWGAVLLYGMARGISAKTSMFISLLFLLTPVVLFQMGTGLVDVMIAVFILAVLYCAVMFYQSNRLLYFYSAALAAGLLTGMKYNGLFFVPLVIPILCLRWKIRLRHWLGFILILLLAGGGWYLRNFLVLKMFIYPSPFSNGCETPPYFPFSESKDLWGFLMYIPSKLFLLWNDPGLGSLNGGYGLIFWGMGLPAWFYVWGRSIKQKNVLDFWIHLSLIISFAPLMWIPVKDFVATPRYSIFVVVLGILALGQVMAIFSHINYFRRAIKTLCAIFAVLSVGHLSNHWPDYKIIDTPVHDLISDKFISKYSYCNGWPPSRDCQVWGIMDYLTANDRQGLSTYIVSKWPLDEADAYGYGTKLQNRIWNLQQNKSKLPDAFLFRDKDAKFKLKDFGPEFSFEKLMNDSDYLFVSRKPRSLLFIRKSIFQNPKRKQLLINYYKVTGLTAQLPLIK